MTSGTIRGAWRESGLSGLFSWFSLFSSEDLSHETNQIKKTNRRDKCYLSAQRRSQRDRPRPAHGTTRNGVCEQKKGAMKAWHPFACSIRVSRLPAIALSTGATAAAATGTLLHRFRFIDR